MDSELMPRPLNRELSRVNRLSSRKNGLCCDLRDPKKGVCGDQFESIVNSVESSSVSTKSHRSKLDPEVVRSARSGSKGVGHWVVENLSAQNFEMRAYPTESEVLV